MTALSLELMDITRDCVSWFVMLCQAFTATDFSCCLFVGLSAFSSVFRKWNKCRRLTWPLQNIPLFHLQRVAFAVCFWYVLKPIGFMKRRPINFAAFGWIWAESTSLYTSELIRLLLSSVTSSVNTSNTVPLEPAHTITLLHHVSQMKYASDHELFSSCPSGTGWS